MSALEASEGHEPCGPSFATLISKPSARVVSFYYNCWRTQALPQAQAWYSRQAQVGSECTVCSGYHKCLR